MMLQVYIDYHLFVYLVFTVCFPALSCILETGYLPPATLSKGTFVGPHRPLHQFTCCDNWLSSLSNRLVDILHVKDTSHDIFTTTPLGRLNAAGHRQRDRGP